MDRRVGGVLDPWRGVPAAERGFGTIPALVVSSLALGRLHPANPGATLLGAVATGGGAGVMLGAAYLSIQTEVRRPSGGVIWYFVGILLLAMRPGPRFVVRVRAEMTDHVPGCIHRSSR